MDTMDFCAIIQKGLAYEADAPINWCPSCKTGLANEEVVDGSCERCGTAVTKKQIKQWLVKITDEKYIERLENDLDGLDWPESIKTLQRNWIGRSQGVEVEFAVDGLDSIITVFTTRPDTLFGATYMVLSPEHELVDMVTTDAQRSAVEQYQKQASAKSDLERTDLAKEKSGVFTGAYAVNPVNAEKIPIWLADYVLSSYGTGAIMAVPAHDERDYEFAKKFKLPIRPVIKPDGIMPQKKFEGMASAAAFGHQQGDIESKCWTGDGTMINSGEFSGLDSQAFKEKITDWLQQKGKGKPAVNYKLRDWLFSRQRYWGEPIPIVHCDKCGQVALPEDQLPLLLPDVEKYEPTGTGQSPLAAIDEWVNTKCPECGGAAKRETNTMPQWAGSNWYFLRYCDPKNDKQLADPEKIKKWLPVDLYIGGAEHAVLHLLYARFIYKFLFDIGTVPPEVGDEPFKKLKNQGLIMGEDGVKMSKSRGNVINPDVIIDKYGADTMRMYEMFMGPFEDKKPWSMDSIRGIRRFLERLWEMQEKVDTKVKKINSDSHKYIASITSGLERFRFNTCISDLMKWSNTWKEKEKIAQGDFEVFVKIIYPFAPHIAEEIWQNLGQSEILAEKSWPEYDPDKVQSDRVTIVVQVNGKLRDNLEVDFDATEEQVVGAAESSERIKKYLTKNPKKVVFVKNKLINFVV